MKSLIPFALILSLGLLASCTTTEDDLEPMATTATTKPASTTVTTPGSTTATTSASQGTFVSNVHATSGMAAVTTKDGKRFLTFTNFKTDGGPDLRVYLAENTGLRNFVELGKLESTSGNFSIAIPVEADPAKQRYVLIWCKAFSVLFGNAELK